MSPNADFYPESAVEREEITFKLLVTFFNFPFEETDSPLAKREKQMEEGLQQVKD